MIYTKRGHYYYEDHNGKKYKFRNEDDCYSFAAEREVQGELDFPEYDGGSFGEFIPTISEEDIDIA